MQVNFALNVYSFTFDGQPIDVARTTQAGFRLSILSIAAYGIPTGSRSLALFFATVIYHLLLLQLAGQPERS